MIAFAGMLVGPAQEAGMSYPDPLDEDNIDDYRETYPHFFVFCQLQLGAPMPTPTAHWENAKLIAAIPLEKLKTMTGTDFIEAGLAIGFSSH